MAVLTYIADSLRADGRSEELASATGQAYDLFETLLGNIAAGDDAYATARTIMVVKPSPRGLSGAFWRSVFVLAGGEPDPFKKLADAWQADHWNEALAPELARLVANTALAPILRAALSEGEGRRLARIVALSLLARELGGIDVNHAVNPDRAVAAGNRAICAHYPTELHQLLKTLACWDVRAEQAAEDILGSDFPSPTRLSAEIAALQSRLATVESDHRTSLERRISTLKRHLTAPKSVSARRLANLQIKLERRLLHARLLCWEEALLGAVRSSLAKAMQIEPPAEWLERPDVMQLICGLGGVDDHFRALALELLGRTFGPTPRDLRLAAQNQAFLQRLVRAGIRTEPWLDGIKPLTIAAGGSTLTITLERDAIEVMRMGAPFETCLSPGNFNFFSAIANAADINKAVLFARDAANVVQGRCLIALTDNGDILAFHVYAHANEHAVSVGMRDYVEKLADAMGVEIVGAGRVRSLVAKNWYDDGPRDLTGQIDFLMDGSDFMRALATVTPAELVGRLKSALAGASITPPIVCKLVATEPVRLRPELVLPLLPYLGDTSRIDPWTRQRLVALVRHAGDITSAIALLMPLVRVALTSTDSWLQVHLGRELILLGRPHQALALIRRTRPTRVRDWEDDWSERALVAAEALWALGRPHRALEVALLAAAGGSDGANAFVESIKTSLAKT